MDVIKMEHGSDPLGIQTSGISDIEEKKPLSEEVNLLDLNVTKIKTESIDHRYDIKSEIVFEETAVPIEFPMLKSEVEEEFCELDQVKEVKLEVTAEENEVLTERAVTYTYLRHIRYESRIVQRWRFLAASTLELMRVGTSDKLLRQQDNRFISDTSALLWKELSGLRLPTMACTHTYRNDVIHLRYYYYHYFYYYYLCIKKNISATITCSS
ncbi:uncharacterized protein [Periplaneta americana]|uniref:uncharacterized protein isoform X2 n=1 Tax=Periplaneta americana TaxID=6978 RepID=UPI0037E89300